MQKRFFEVELAHEPYVEEKEPEDAYFMCIVGIKHPTIKEAEHFLEYDMKNMGYEHIISVTETDESDAHHFYDMTEVDKFPVFGIDFPMSAKPLNPNDFPLFSTEVTEQEAELG